MMEMATDKKKSFDPKERGKKTTPKKTKKKVKG